MITYLKPDKNYYIIDIETDGLISLDRTRWPTKIWCICVLNVETQEFLVFSERLSDFCDWYNRVQPILVGHNLLSFDIQVIKHLLGLDIPWDNIIDTLVLSQLYDPQMPAPEGLKLTQRHSLEAWGLRLKMPKQEHYEWDRFSDEMLERCRSDTRLNRALYLALSTRMAKRGFSELSCYIEHGAHVVIDEQMANGIAFDTPKAKELLQCLRSEQDRLTDKIRQTFKPELKKIGDYRYRERADGQPYASFLRHLQWVESQPGSQLRWNADQSQYSLWEEAEFNIASPPQRLKRLLELGFIPQKKTKKGNPQVDEESLLEFAKDSGIEEVREIADWLVIFGRANAVENWLTLSNHETSRLHGRVFSCGAANRRCTHSSPNTANIPKVKTKYGRECRSLFRAADGRMLVGIDAKSLQMRIFGHYLGDLKTAQMYIEGDPHQYNSNLISANPWGYKCERDTGAKNGFYCVPLDIKILTRRGFKFHDELVIGEEVLGYNQQTNQKEWTKLTAINYKEDEVIQFGTSQKQFRATKDHRWFIRQRRMGLNSWSKINGRYLEDQVRSTEELNTESNIILNAPFNRSQDQESRVQGLTGKYDVDWEQRILEMSHSEREQWLQGFLVADGHIIRNTGHWCWGQNKNNIADGALLASYLVNPGTIYVSERNGYNERMIICRLSAKQHITCTTMEKRSIGVQKVWCPTTELGSWVAKDGWNIYITGNCFIFGGQDKKLGLTFDTSIVDAKKATEYGCWGRAELMKNTPGLERLVRDVQREFTENQGFLQTIDGGFVRCPSEHAALNYKIASGEACLMKLVDIRTRERFRREGLDYLKVLDVHDEDQYETTPELADYLGQLGCEIIRECGEELGFIVPMAGSFNKGQNWSETH